MDIPRAGFADRAMRVAADPDVTGAAQAAVDRVQYVDRDIAWAGELDGGVLRGEALALDVARAGQ